MIFSACNLIVCESSEKLREPVRGNLSGCLIASNVFLSGDKGKIQRMTQMSWTFINDRSVLSSRTALLLNLCIYWLAGSSNNCQAGLYNIILLFHDIAFSLT